MENDEKKKVLNRRNLMRGGLVSAGLFGLSFKALGAGACRLTAPQPEGPFYPIEDQLDKNNDLTKVRGRIKKARGEVVILKGVVRDQNCKPIKGALVEIWQACDTGKYNHPGDPNTADLDPNFQYWGQMVTNAKGEYIFKTIKPGAYPANNTWVRPPHIHMKVSLRGHEEIITQVYFSEEVNLNNKDRILRSLNRLDKKDAIVQFKKVPHSKFRTGVFEVTLKSL